MGEHPLTSEFADVVSLSRKLVMIEGGQQPCCRAGTPGIPVGGTPPCCLPEATLPRAPWNTEEN